MVKDLSVDLCGIRLQNPVVPASGTFGFGLELADSMDLNVIGGISLKGTTREARYGNPTPRIAECDGGMINSVGLQNPGIDVLVGEKVPALRKVYNGCVIANISGFSLDEYRECCAKADACEGIDIIEVNISCPNVHNGGMAFGTNPASAAEVTKTVKAVCKGHKDRESGLQKARFHQAQPERDGHRGHRPRLRGRRGRRSHAREHFPGDAHRHRPPETRDCQ